MTYAQVAAEGVPHQSHGSFQYHGVDVEHRVNFQRTHLQQRYEPHSTANVVPSSSELQNLSGACSKLWQLDANRLKPGEDFEINVENGNSGRTVIERGDMASNNLFRQVNPHVFTRSTIARFYCLLDNYHSDSRVKEVVTRDEQAEQSAFIEEIYRTAPIKFVHEYLSRKGILSKDPDDFKSALKNLWFSLYNRGGGHASSSAFEHIFVGELKAGRDGSEQVIGFHNWIQFYLEESKGNVDYQGLVLPSHRHREHPDSHSQLLTINFKWNSAVKRESSIFIGTSPEFEIALFTICFFAGEEDNYLDLGPYRVNVKIYRLGDKIGSSFISVP